MKLIILDRDGVINKESRDYIKKPEEWLPIPGSLEAIARLAHANYTIVIATNQSGVGRGYYNLAMLEQIHNKMRTEIAKLGGKIDKIYFCPHTPDANCNCRKPKLGLFEQIAHDYAVELNKLQPPFVGDSLRDVQVALATGCKFFLVTGAYSDGKETYQQLSAQQLQQITVTKNLATATEQILCNN